MEKRWISPRECAEYLSLHLKSIYRKIDCGEIPAARVGRSVRVDLRALEAKMLGQAKEK
jgi:excisionase family DNA binding protein